MPNPRKRRDTGTPPLFPRVAASITEEQREHALNSLADAVENLNRATRAIERGFHGWPGGVYVLISPNRRVSSVLESIKAQVDSLSGVADGVLNLKPTL